jgi:flagellum-specific peptidoglycan hydrolase FlgJ
MQTQSSFLVNAANAARAAGHIWPAHAACETALESAWGASRLALEANNLFGQKQTASPMDGTDTLELPTREYLHGEWVEQMAAWVKFPNLAACFRARMEMLRREAARYPHFAAALAATSGGTGSGSCGGRERRGGDPVLEPFPGVEAPKIIKTLQFRKTRL